MPEILSRNVLLNIKNLNGSAQHYYHFLLGFLLPLASEIEDLQLNDEIKSIIIRSCGPMDRHIKALNLSKIVIYDANTAGCVRKVL